MIWTSLSEVPSDIRGLGLERASFWEEVRRAAVGLGQEDETARATAWAAISYGPSLDVLDAISAAPAHVTAKIAQRAHGLRQLAVKVPLEPPVFTATVDLLGDLLRRSFGEYATEQVSKAADQIAEISEMDLPPPAKWAKAKKVVDDLQKSMELGGKELPEQLRREVGRYLAVAYRLGKSEILTPLGWSTSFQLADRDAIAALHNAGVFWIGKHYGAAIDMPGALEQVRQVMLVQGLGRKAGGLALAKHFGGQIKRSDTYWAGLAAVMATRTRSFGALSGMEAAGAVRYEYVNPLDERTSDVCRHLNGTLFTIKGALQLRDQLLQAKDPEAWKAIAPWPNLKGLHDANGKPLKPAQLQAKGVAFPPMHMHCRSSIVVRVWQAEDPDAWESVPDSTPKPKKPKKPKAAVPALPFPDVDPPPVLPPPWSPTLPSNLLTADPSTADWMALARLNGYTSEELENLLASLKVPAEVSAAGVRLTFAQAVAVDDQQALAAWMAYKPPAVPGVLLPELTPPSAWAKLASAYGGNGGPETEEAFDAMQGWLAGAGYHPEEVKRLLIKGPGGVVISGSKLHPTWSPAEVALYLHEHPPPGKLMGWPPRLLPSEWYTLKGEPLEHSVGIWLEAWGYAPGSPAREQVQAAISRALKSGLTGVAKSEKLIRSVLSILPPPVSPGGSALAATLKWPPSQLPVEWYAGPKDGTWARVGIWLEAWGYDLQAPGTLKAWQGIVDAIGLEGLSAPARLAKLQKAIDFMPTPAGGWAPKAVKFADGGALAPPWLRAMGYNDGEVEALQAVVDEALEQSIALGTITAEQASALTLGSQAYQVATSAIAQMPPQIVRATLPWAAPDVLPSHLLGEHVSTTKWQAWLEASFGYEGSQAEALASRATTLIAVAGTPAEAAPLIKAMIGFTPPRALVPTGPWVPAIEADTIVGASDAFHNDWADWSEALEDLLGSLQYKGQASSAAFNAVAATVEGLPGGTTLSPQQLAAILQQHPPDHALMVGAAGVTEGPVHVTAAQLWQSGAPDATVALSTDHAVWSGWLQSQGYSVPEVEALIGDAAKWKASIAAGPVDWPPKLEEIQKALPQGWYAAALGEVGSGTKPVLIGKWLGLSEASGEAVQKAWLDKLKAVGNDYSDPDWKLKTLQAALAEVPTAGGMLGGAQGLTGEILTALSKGQATQLRQAQDVGAAVVQSLATKPPGKVIVVKPAPVAVLDPDEYGKRLTASTGAPPLTEMGSAHTDMITGSRVWVREVKEEAHASHQAVAAALYRDLGIDVPAVRVARIKGKLAAVQDDVAGWSPKAIGTWDAEDGRRLSAEMPADALLGNWNVAGTSRDRILWREQPAPSGGRLLRSLNDGVLGYRSTGALKGAAWGPKVTELETLLDTTINPNAAELFGAARADRSILLPMMDKIGTLTDAQISQAVQAGALRGAEAEALASTLRARRDYVAAEAKVLRRALVEEAKAEAEARARRIASEARMKELLASGELLPPAARPRGLDVPGLLNTLETVGPRSVAGDHGIVRNQHLRVERYRLQKGASIQADGYAVTMELDRSQWERVSGAITKGGGKRGTWRAWQRQGFGTKADNAGSPVTVWDSSKPSDFLGSALISDRGPVSLDFVDQDGATAMQGYLRIRVNDLDPIAAQEAIRKTLTELGIEQAIAAPTTETEILMLANRVSWVDRGAKHVEMKTYAEASAFLKGAGIDPAAIVGTSTGRGYVEYRIPGRSEAYRAKGLRYAYHGFSGDEKVLNSVFGWDGGPGGLIATTERTHAGVVVSGMSSSRDLETGGGSSVFLRLVGQKGSASNYFASWGDYQAIVDPAIMDRLDWYGYNSDNYGSTINSTWASRSGASAHLAEINKSGTSSNEVMFRWEVGLKDILLVRCDSEESRKKAITRARAAGVSEINGTPIDAYFVVMANPTDFTKLDKTRPAHARVMGVSP